VLVILTHLNTEDLAPGQLTSTVLPTKIFSEQKVTWFDCDRTFEIAYSWLKRMQGLNRLLQQRNEVLKRDNDVNFFLVLKGDFVVAGTLRVGVAI